MSSIERESMDWAVSNGLVMSTDTPGRVNHAPFTLAPTVVPAGAFHRSVAATPLLHTVIDLGSRDVAFLKESLEKVLDADAFTKRCYDLWVESLAHGPGTPVELGLHRVDYLIDTRDNLPKLVEFNTIAASLAGLSGLTGRLHKYLHERFGTGKINQPENNAVQGLAQGMAEAVRLYEAHHDVTGTAVMMVVLSGETNSSDQRQLEFELWEAHQIPMVFATMAEMAVKEDTRTDDLVHAAVHHSGKEVAVVYYRSGYMPEHYPTEEEWSGRRRMELGRAIKSPNVAYHLMGCKKVQQRLAMPGMLERFLPREEASLVRSTIVGHYSMEAGERDPVAIERALARPGDFVLKPQREGGGNNLYDEDVRTAIQTMPDSELAAFIMMDIIQAPPTEADVLRSGQMLHASILSELGIYGIFVRHGDAVVTNRACGHLLRSKTATSRETGINAGFGMMDSVQLVDKKVNSYSCTGETPGQC